MKLLLKTMVFLGVLFYSVESRDNRTRIAKRSASVYSVEGCFRMFPPGSLDSSDMGIHQSSNIRCQEICRDKGYVLAATKGQMCHCSNIYPRGKKVVDQECSTRCRSYTPCHDVQSCCGGPNAYSVSVVGDIDVAKQTLRRLANKWQTNVGYHNSMLRHVGLLYDADWRSSIENGGWSKCNKEHYINGLSRENQYSGSSSDPLGRIDYASCQKEPGDQVCNYQFAFLFTSGTVWKTCKQGYFMSGVFTQPGAQKISDLAQFHCCRPKKQKEQWGHCYNHDVSSSLDNKGWSTCRSGYFMAGMERGYCDGLHCVNQIKCCQMESLAVSENPKLSIKLKDTTNKGQLKECTMEARDLTPESKTYECKSLSNLKDVASLESVSFKMEDESDPLTSKPERVKNYIPVICMPASSDYECKKVLAVSVAQSSTLTIGSGFSMTTTFGVKTAFEANWFGQKFKNEISFELSASSSLNIGTSKTTTKTVTDTTWVTVKVPANQQVMIDLLRQKIDIVYKWSGVFRLLGKYKMNWQTAKKEETKQDITTVLSGPDREMYAFGKWKYPNTDVLQVVVTDKYGEKKGCEHATGVDKNCLID
ncbi:uncharacterized protein [Clytia hemisphaerica]|uniref:WSC domain-containing protein n=1 Tax=Clytia hemisphaerica TaxID=252671 RepID=A0A7M5X3G3_9CNID